MQAVRLRSPARLLASGRAAPSTPRRLRAQVGPAGVNSTTAELIQELQTLVSLGEPHRRVLAESVKPNIEKIQALSASLGTDRVDLAVNDGSFTGLLTTDLRQVTEEGATTLGRVSFSQFQPASLQISLQPQKLSAADTAGVPAQLKGAFEGRTNAYVINFCFCIEEEPSAAESSSADKAEPPAGLMPPPPPLVGLISSIGSYEQSPDLPARLIVKFQTLRMQQAPTQAADPLLRKRWYDLLKPHNSAMDEQGVTEVNLPKPPVGHLDYLVMLPDWHVSRGNFGSVVVLKRA